MRFVTSHKTWISRPTKGSIFQDLDNLDSKESLNGEFKTHKRWTKCEICRYLKLGLKKTQNVDIYICIFFRSRIRQEYFLVLFLN